MNEKRFTFVIPEDVITDSQEGMINHEDFAYKDSDRLPELHDTAYFSKRYNPTERVKMAEKLRTLRKEQKQLKPDDVLEFGVSSAEDKRLEIGEVQELLKKNKAREDLGMTVNTEENERQISKMSETIDNDVYLSNATVALSDFISNQDIEREHFVREQEARSVAELSKKNDLFFIHTLDMKSPRDARCLIAMAPTISTSTVWKRQVDGMHQDTYGRMGFVLAEGTVLAAHDHDVDSSATYDGKRFISGIDRAIISSPKEIQNVMETKSHRTGRNECFVERPVIKSIYFDLDSPSTLDELKKMRINNSNRSPTDTDVLQWRDTLCQKFGIPNISVVVRRNNEMLEIKDGNEIDVLKPTPEKRKEILGDLFKEKT